MAESGVGKDALGRTGVNGTDRQTALGKFEPRDAQAAAPKSGAAAKIRRAEREGYLSSADSADVYRAFKVKHGLT